VIGGVIGVTGSALQVGGTLVVMFTVAANLIAQGCVCAGAIAFPIFFGLDPAFSIIMAVLALLWLLVRSDRGRFIVHVGPNARANRDGVLVLK
jgi:hypothetical protein